MFPLNNLARKELMMSNTIYISDDIIQNDLQVLARFCRRSCVDTVEPLYNTIVFHQNTHKRHPIARP